MESASFFAAFFVNRSFSDTPVFPEYVYQGYLFGFFTIMGLIIALTRLVDAAAGVLAGHASDRSRMKRGRRTGFMLVAARPARAFLRPRVHARPLRALRSSTP